MIFAHKIYVIRCIQGHYQNYNLQLSKATNINQGKIDGVGLVLAPEDINIPCVHAGVRRLACIPNINQPMRSKRVGLLCLGEKKYALIDT